MVDISLIDAKLSSKEIEQSVSLAHAVFVYVIELLQI